MSNLRWRSQETPSDRVQLSTDTAKPDSGQEKTEASNPHYYKLDKKDTWLATSDQEAVAEVCFLGAVRAKKVDWKPWSEVSPQAKDSFRTMARERWSELKKISEPKGDKTVADQRIEFMADFYKNY